MKRLIVAWVFVLLWATAAFAQFETGSITGTVQDKSGGVLPGVAVTLRNLDTGVTQTAVTNDSGAYEFFTLRPGRYEVKAELSGFSTTTIPEVRLAIGARQRADVEMGVGTLSEAVEVKAATVALERDSSQRSQVITAAQAVALPLNGREYSALMALSPGVRRSAINVGGSTPREGAFTINGLRSTFNNFLLDGIDNNAYGTSNQGFSNQVMQPPPDAIAEFRVVTNNMSAEYGRSGGGTVNVAYKSGTNTFSGAAWEYRRDPSLNAVGFFRPAAGTEPTLKRDQYGFVFGGPVLRNRAFFFTDYEGFRQDRSTVTFSTIPTADQRQGLLGVDVTDPRTGQVYRAGTPIPMTAFARKVLTELPAPDTTGANNYRETTLFTNDSDKYNVKLDGKVSDKLSLFGRYGYRKVDLFDQPPLPLPSGGGGNGNTYVRNKQLGLGATYMPGGTQLLEVRFGWSSTQAGKNPLALGLPGAGDAYGLAGLPTDPRVAGGLPAQSITGYTALGRQNTNPQWQYPEAWNPKINYSFVRGKQSFKIGYEFQHVSTEVQDVNPLYGLNVYSGQFSRPGGTSAANNLYNLADFMLGLQSQYALSNILVANMRQNMHFLYVQDDYRLNDKLTLNLGLRYEYATPQWERDNVLTNFDPVNLTMIQATDGSIEDRSTIKPDRNNFGPRLGFAYSATPATVVRGGFGTSYVHFQRAGGGNLLPINGPQVINAVAVQNDPRSASFRTAEQGFPIGWTDASNFNPVAANITYMPNDYHASRVDSWFISVQRELFKSTIVDVAYVGNRARGLLLFANYNQGRPNNPGENASLQSRRPIAQFGDITYASNLGKSDYQGFQLKVETRVRGVYFLNALTLSRARDNGSGSLENPNGNFPAPQDFNNIDAEWATSGYNQPYNWTSSIVWEVPVGHERRFLGGASALTDALIGGWQIAVVSQFNAGDPVTFTYTPSAAGQVSGITADFRGANNYRPNIIGDPYGDKSSITNYLDRAAVSIPSPNEPFGSAERNLVRGPNFWQVDFSLQKRFRLPVGSNTGVEVRGDFFNLFNRTNFSTPNGNASSAAFGTITSTFDPRQVQLGVRVTF